MAERKWHVSYNGESEVLDGLREGDWKPLEEEGKVYGGCDAEEGGGLSSASHGCLMVLCVE